jgi:putative endonuclease
MCYLYILQNNKDKYYTGITELLPETRLLKHNKGDVYSTKFGRPWKLIYVEECEDIIRVRKREKQIKSWHSGNAFKKLLIRAAGSSNGRTSPSEGEYLGSNPSPAALNRS